MNPLDIDITPSQKFEIEKAKRVMKTLTREELEQVCLNVLTLSYQYQNAFKSIVKNFNK